ncbi:MAG: methyltransferase domain-containing protein [bacterium]|nr:methyltransferase domain-containing protein [bacterium]
MTDEQPYVLGTGDDELERLGLQSRLWGDVALTAFRRAGIRLGHRVLDVGCGPGHASFDLAQLVTSRGEVVAVDESAEFLTHLREQIVSRNLPQITPLLGDVQELDTLLAGADTNSSGFDLAFARWVLCFVARPAAVVTAIANALRPGGRVIVHDYFHYESMTLAPHSKVHDRAVAATAKAWRDRGGDPDIVGRLPAMMRDADLEIERLECLQRSPRGTDSMYAWVDVWWHTFAPKLVEQGRLDAGDCDQLLAEMAERRGDPDVFIHCPPVYELVAVKR